MSNSIWKTPDQEQERTKDIYTLAEYKYERVCYDLDDFVFRNADLKRWCYLDDLIAQADKAERLQKAVDYALQVLDDVIEIGGIDLEIAKIKKLIKVGYYE